MKKISFILTLFLIGCGGGSSSDNKSIVNKVTIADGYIISGDVHIKNSKGKYLGNGIWEFNKTGVVEVEKGAIIYDGDNDPSNNPKTTFKLYAPANSKVCTPLTTLYYINPKNFEKNPNIILNFDPVKALKIADKNLTAKGLIKLSEAVKTINNLDTLKNVDFSLAYEKLLNNQKIDVMDLNIPPIFISKLEKKFRLVDEIIKKAETANDLAALYSILDKESELNKDTLNKDTINNKNQISEDINEFNKQKSNQLTTKFPVAPSYSNPSFPPPPPNL